MEDMGNGESNHLWVFAIAIVAIFAISMVGQSLAGGVQ